MADDRPNQCSSSPHCWVGFLVGWLAVLFSTHFLFAGEPGRGPLTPEQEAVTFQFADDRLVAELVAAEPDVNSPVAIAWDADGRMFVAEMIDYPLGPTAGQIRLLEDRDGDGRYEHATVFADGINFPTGVLCLADGVLVTAAPDILRLRDLDGDGVADEREVLFTGFGTGNQQLRVNGLTCGLDNWIYGANGRSDGHVRRPHDPPDQAVSIRTRDFRFKPDGSRFEAVTGQSQFGQARDDYGNRFLSWNTIAIRQALLDDGVLDRNPRLAVLAVHDLADHADHGEVFPISPRAQTFNRERTDFYNALCGLTIYRGDAMGDDYQGNAFVGESLTNLVHRRVLRPDGPTFVSVRGEQGRDFLAASDPWFHPVYLATGPDGALYVVDFYRRWVEHPQFVAENLRESVDWREGAGHGRIWRIRRRDGLPATVARLSGATPAQLVDFLSHPNGWVRDTAQRLLVERQETQAVPLLQRLATSGASIKGRLHALWTLDGLGALDDETLAVALDDGSAAVRKQGLRLVGARWAESEALRKALLALADDPDAAIHFRLALVLGNDPREHVAALIKLAETIDEEPWTAIALSGSIGSAAGAFLVELLRADQKWLDRPTSAQLSLLVQIGQLIGGQAGKPEAILPTLELAVTDQEPRRVGPGALAIVVGLARGMADQGRSFSAALREAQSDGHVGWLALVAALPAIRQLALDPEQAVEYRLAAIEVLGIADTPEHGRDLMLLLAPGVPEPIQMGAAAALSQLADAELAAEIFSDWSG
ncbi:MAG TPA: PVC-type heme-binding CxxCH protein, partial [Pirellulales bacterium]|nr:PVC-type heme-binding CxxCH protein [Pirellulales bacterium]